MIKHACIWSLFSVFILTHLVAAGDIRQPGLRSKNPAERAMAARRIAETGNYEAPDIPLLIDCFTYKTRLIPSNVPIPAAGPFSRDQRETTPGDEAEKALVRIGKPTVPDLITALNQADSDFRRYAAARCLGKIGDQSALPHLIRLADQGEYGHPGSRGFGDEIPVAIAKISRKDAYDVLLRAFLNAADNKRLNSRLFEALGYSRDDRFIPLLQKHLNQGDRYRKIAILIALGHIASEKAIPLLLPYVNSKDWHLQKYSRSSLKELGREDLIPK